MAKNFGTGILDRTRPKSLIFYVEEGKHPMRVGIIHQGELLDVVRDRVKELLGNVPVKVCGLTKANRFGEQSFYCFASRNDRRIATGLFIDWKKYPNG